MNPDDILQSVREVILLDSEGNRITVTNPILVAPGDSAGRDAFGRDRVSELAGQFDSQSQYDDHRLFWQNKITNNSGFATGTHLPNESAVKLTVGANDSIIRQSRGYQRYQPGKGQFILMTWAGMSPNSEITRRGGYFDGDNGIFFELNASTSRFVLRSKATGAVVDTQVDQSDWNLDKLNGAGSSGFNLDVTTSQILVIDLEWLGVGRVRCGFVIDGRIVYCHQFLNANINPTVYMTTANLPVRYEIEATSMATGTHSYTAICSQVSSEGGFENERGIPFAVSNGGSLLATTTRRPIISIRPKATFNSVVNRGRIELEEFSIYSQDQDVFYEIVYGGTLTGASFASVADDSITERDISATAISGGLVIRDGYQAAGGVGSGARAGTSQESVLSKLPIALDIDGNHPTSPFTDIVTLVATSIPGTSTDVGGVIDIREIR